MKRPSNTKRVSILPIVAVLLFCLVGAVSADNWVGGQPLTTVQTGTVSGGLWYDADPPTFAMSVTKDFTLPADVVNGATWARLYVSTYNGHMQDQRHGSIEITWDNDADSVIEETWNEDLDVPFTFIVNGGNDNTGEGGGPSDPYKIVNDHCNRVTSDYVMWYDVYDLGLLTSETIRVNAVATAEEGSSFDGRIKEVALVVAYDDGDSEYIRYWVNQGHDSCSYYTEDNNHVAAVGSTTFATTGFDSVDSATLTSIYMASNNGYYGFPTQSNSFTWTGGTPPVTGTFTNLALDNTPDIQGDYSGVDSWDVTSSVTGSAATTLGYARYFPASGTSAFYKIQLALLVVKGTELEITDPPDAEFSADPTSGDPPLTVQFTDESTNAPDTWFWDFGDGENSEDQHPSHEYVRPGTYTVSLTATNVIGDDTEIKDDYITVSSMWEATSAWNAPDPGSYSGPAIADLDDDGDYDLMIGDGSGISYGYENTGSATSPSWAAKSAWNSPDAGSRARAALVDIDNDGDSDLFVGGQGGACIAYENTGSATSPAWTARSGWNTPDPGTYTAPTFADLDNDGDYDVLVGEQTGICYGYENTGTATSPVWAAKSAWNTPDIGASGVNDFSSPAFIDIDWDGDDDLLIGAGGTSATVINGLTYAYENTGSASSPEWTANPAWDVVDDVGTYAVPGVGDLDKDGDFDLLVGSYAGISYAFRNTAPSPTDCDLTISGIVNVASPTNLFAREGNSIVINQITNNGPSSSPATEVLLTSSDGFSARADVPALAKNEETTITITDTTIRETAGATVTYTATVDPDDLATETDETNNVKTSFGKVVTYNGYKGKMYWDGGSNVTTSAAFDLHGGLVHSFGDSVYHSGSFGFGWTTYTVTWTAADLPIPAGATVREARLYVPYCWDNSNQAPDHVTIDFNTATDIPYQDWYHDVSNFGAYSDHVYGLLTYNVTTQFLENDVNTAVFTREGELEKISPYGFTLAVVYEDATATRKQIFLNEEFDLLGASPNEYATSSAEATAYVPFSGLAVNPANVVTADLTTFVPSGEMNEGNLLFNGVTVATNLWDYGSSDGPQVAVDTRDVKMYLSSTANEAAIQSTERASACMAASQQFLVLTLTEDTPVAGFSADPTTGTTTAPVTFTDTSAGTITGRVWDFGDGNSSYSTTETVIPHTYALAGTYSVNLTVIGPGGLDSELKENYIAITEGVQPPVAAFSADKFMGLAPLSVIFTDQSTNTPTEWLWEFRNYDGDWEVFNTTKNPVRIFTTAGTYDIRLTATNSGGSDIEEKTHLVAVSGGRDPLETSQGTSGTVTGNLSVQSFGLWSATESTKSFTLPAAAVGNIQWARLYVNTYGGSAANTYGHKSTVEFDGNGDSDYLDAGEVLGVEICDIGSEQNGNSYPLNDHITKVFSDYEAEYDVTSLISATNPSAHVKSEAISGKTFDGRQKTITLVVAYNDPSSTTTTHYWVNHGQDWFDADYGGDTGSTSFSTSSLEAGFDNAVGTDLCTSSVEGTYTFNGISQPQGIVNPTYFCFHTWDLLDEINDDSDSTLTFGRGSGAPSFKTTLATLAVTYATDAPVAAFTASPDTGDRPLDVTFIDASTGSITSWDLDFGDGSTHGSGPGPWTHTYTTRNTYTATLMVTGPGGTDSTTRTVTVKEPAPAVTFTADSTSGTEPLEVSFDATNTGGVVTSWKWEYKLTSAETWTQFADTEDSSFTFNDPGIYDIRVTATGPDYTDIETQPNCISVGEAVIEVTLASSSINFGSMQAGTDATNSTTVTVTTDGGAGWSVTASDPKTTNKGFMVSDSTPLANAFQLSNDGGTNYNPLTSDLPFMSGSGAGSVNNDADVKQAVAQADAVGTYEITVTFTGAFA